MAGLPVGSPVTVKGRVQPGTLNVTVSSTATVNVDASQFNNVNVTATANTTLWFNNGVDHQTLRVRFIQAGAGGYVLSVGPNVRFGSVITDLSDCVQAAGIYTYLSLVFNAATGYWDVVAVNPGFSTATG